ncbi:Uncharacterized protein FKW44_009106, partial [Caligus rogercresseyi]
QVLVRYGLSVRAATAYGNALLNDLHLSTKENLLSPSKVYYQAKKYCDQSLRLHKENKGFICIKFDGRKDLTRCSTEFSKKEKHEEHIPVISEPQATYVNHFTPISGKAIHIANELHSLIVESDSADSLRAIGSDGAPVNTGYQAGVIRHLEQTLESPLQWIIVYFI